MMYCIFKVNIDYKKAGARGRAWLGERGGRERASASRPCEPEALEGKAAGKHGSTSCSVNKGKSVC